MAETTEKKHTRSREGLSEYLIVLALLVLAAIGTLAVFGQDIREIFGVPARVQSSDTVPKAPAP